MKDQLAEVQRNLQEARRLAGTGELRPAIDHARRAVQLADDLAGDEPVVFEARGAAHAELGLLLQRAGDPMKALAALLDAERQVRRLPYEEGSPRYRLLVATTIINLAGLYTKQRRLDAASTRIAEAMALLESADDAGPAATVLLIGALQNRAAIEAEERRMADAERSLARALELGETLVSSAPQLLPQLVDVSGRLAGVLKSLDRASDAVTVAEKAARWAEAAYDAGSQLGLPLYVSTQLQLVDANFAARRFAQAEDHLWKAIDVAPGAQTILVGAGFYASLLRLEPEDLAQGDLPRDEVVEAFDELVVRLHGSDPPAGLLALVEARRAVLVDGDLERGRSAVGRLESEQSSVIRELTKALRSDLDWAAKHGEF